MSRSDWGADESKRFAADGKESTPLVFAPAEILTVHHTVTVNDDPDPAATVRTIYEMHTKGNDWGDIGYHFLVDQAGRMYEGRYSGAKGAPGHNSVGEVVTAAHTLDANTGNIGIALLGDFTDREPPLPMRHAVTQLLASLAAKHGLNPVGTVVYRGAGRSAERSLPAISGHRDWLSTECPGAQTYRTLPKLREEAAKLIVP
ncbi:peptidoglycan recognition family protein [Streptomyces sp. NPDC017943]|uniref:peptidoglycan recognition family protein n=1 Tax=Streptomyces sp. NPDC017943 TaxID=3365019 RepID=UPI0037B2BF00